MVSRPWARRSELVGLHREGVAGRRPPGGAPPDEEPAVPGVLAETVRLTQRGPVRRVDPSAGAQRFEGTHGARAAHAVAQLQELDGPLDVRQGAPPQFQVELGILVRRDPLAFDPGLHPPDGGHIRVGEGRFPDEPLGPGHEAFPQGAIAGHDPGPEHGLALPGLTPAIEVGAVGAQVPGQASDTSLGPETEIDGGDTLRRAVPAQQVQKGLGRRFGLIRRGVVVHHQEEVEIAGVGELTAAQPAHPHHAHPRHGRAVDSRHGRLEQPFGEVREGRPHRGHIALTQQVVHRDAHVLLLAQPDELGATAVGVSGVAVAQAYPLHGLAGHGLPAQWRQGVVVVEGGDELGVPGHRFGEHPAGAEQEAEAPRRFGRFPEGGDQDRAVVGMDHQVPQSQQAKVRIRGE